MPICSREYMKKSNDFSGYLIDNGMKKGDRVVTMINNSPEWNIAEIGILQAGGIHVPLSPLYNDIQLKSILNTVYPAWLLSSSKSLLLRLQSIADELSIKCSGKHIKDGTSYCSTHATDEIESRKKAINADDSAVVLFTSGSTGLPKGVVLSHKNILTSVNEFSETDIFQECKRSISFLQLCQSAERKLNYSYQLRGITTCYPASHKNLLENILLFEPQITALVPFLLNELYQQLNSSNAVEKSLRKFVCGGAAIPIKLFELFKEKSIDVYEVYGLTETASLLAYNSKKNYKIGTVGKISPSVEVALSDDGELLVKGDCVMKGYLTDKFQLDLARDKNGWFHTGDIVNLDHEGFLSITGRKKNAFKNSKGAYVYPEEIEQYLIQHPIFDNVVVFGDNADSLSVIFKLKDSVARNPSAENDIQEIIKNYNKGKGDELKISQFMILNGKFNSDLLSASMKLNRKKIAESCTNDKFIAVS